MVSRGGRRLRIGINKYSPWEVQKSDQSIRTVVLVNREGHGSISSTCK